MREFDKQRFYKKNKERNTEINLQNIHLDKEATYDYILGQQSKVAKRQKEIQRKLRKRKLQELRMKQRELEKSKLKELENRLVKDIVKETMKENKKDEDEDTRETIII